MLNQRFRSAFVLALLITVSAGFTSKVSAQTASTPSEPVYSRVLQSKKIRAAWLIYPPAVMKDASTGKLTGTFVDTLETVAHNLGLEVEWAANETPWAEQIAGLDSDKFDIVGSPVWANPTRGKLTTLSNPVYYSSIGIYVRANDQRFGKDWAMGGTFRGEQLINRSNMRIGVLEGETGEVIARNQFPLATTVPVPRDSTIPSLLQQVVDRQADLVFVEPYFAVEFQKNNPGKIVNVAEQHPVRVLGNVFMFRKGEHQFKQMIDVALEELQNNGGIDQLLTKYENEPGIFPRARPNYEILQTRPSKQLASR